MLRVLYWGHDDGAPIPYFRAAQFGPHLAANDVVAAYVWLFDPQPDAVPLDWPDVAVFRRFYKDDVSERAWDAAAGHCARIYDTDDWDLGTTRWNPWYELVNEQRPLIERMVREADVVTVATPELARLYAPYSRRPPVVVRNAIEPALYERDQARDDHHLTALYYGATMRLRDYFGTKGADGKWRGGHAHAAVKELGLRSLWMGAERPVRHDFDLVVTYDHNMRRFFRALGNAPADIGLAPLIEDDFNRAKSELHWLEMSAAGLPVVAEQFRHGGPYDVIRHGVDGVLARGAQGWYDAVRRLVREPNHRADLVAAARARLATDYDPAARAAEWADVFRSA